MLPGPECLLQSQGSILVVIKSLISIGSRRRPCLRCGWKGVPGRSVGRRGLWEAGLRFRRQCDQGLGEDLRGVRESKQGNFVSVRA